MPETARDYDDTSEAPPGGVLLPAAELHVQIPMLDEPVGQGDALPALSAQATTGMQLLNRIIDEQARYNRRRAWPRRLQLAALALTGLSAATLGLAFVQRQNESHHKDRDLAAQTELYRDLDLQSPVQHHAENDLAPQDVADTSAAGAGSRSAVSSAGYEAPPERPLRGAWLTGTIIADDSEHR
ncbi:MAG: hypothetical protein ACT4QC_20005 [Planctomycetaceae bacterium]